jgi:hypothetical protein
LEPVVATIGKEWSLGRDTSCPRLQGWFWLTLACLPSAIYDELVSSCGNARSLG